MSKVSGLNWELPRGGESREAKEAMKFQRERGLDKPLSESAAGREAKAMREVQVLKALGFAAEKIEVLKEKISEKKDLTESDLRPLQEEIKVLKRQLKRMTIKGELQVMATNPSAVSGLKHSLREKESLVDIDGTILLIEQFQSGEIGAEKLLSELEKRGVFNFS